MLIEEIGVTLKPGGGVQIDLSEPLLEQKGHLIEAYLEYLSHSKYIGDKMDLAHAENVKKDVHKFLNFLEGLAH
jgi:hypothetical protein